MVAEEAQQVAPPSLRIRLGPMAATFNHCGLVVAVAPVVAVPAVASYTSFPTPPQQLTVLCRLMEVTLWVMVVAVPAAVSSSNVTY